MIKAQDVQFWTIRKRTGRPKPYEVRWRVDGASFSKSYATKALAETYRASLVAAARAGERFATVKPGEPVSWARSAETFYLHARGYSALRWPESAANTRKSLAEVLAVVTLAYLDARKGNRDRPDGAVLRKALREWAFNPSTWAQDPPPEVAGALAWIAAASRPVAEMGDFETGRATMRAMLGELALKLNGKRAARSTLQRRRAVLHCCLEHAVERRLLSGNPLDGLSLGPAQTAASRAVDPRGVPSLPQARRLLAAVGATGRVRGARLYGFFATMYYAGMRPAEVRNLRVTDLYLPASGWGTATLSGSAPDVGGDWTDDGGQYEARGLKHRAEGTVRIVPLPPVLVAVLRAHLDTHGPGQDGRVFWSGKDAQPVSGDTYRSVWLQARATALTPAELAANLAPRAYDLRHGNASFLLASGVPPAEVARRLGHTVATLTLVYAHWFDGMEQAANDMIDRALAAADPAAKPVTRENPGHGPTAGQDGTPAAD